MAVIIGQEATVVAAAAGKHIRRKATLQASFISFQMTLVVVVVYLALDLLPR